MVSRGVMMDLMKRLVRTYHEAGGEKWMEESEDGDDEDTKNLSPFEAQKLILAKKIQATRKKIKEREDLLERRKAQNNKVIRLNNEIRKMIKILKSDHNKLLDMQKKNEKKKSIFRKKNNAERENQLLKQREDCELIFMHIVEVEKLDKKRHNKRQAREHDRESLLDDEGFGGESPSVVDNTGMRRLLMQAELPDDATQSNLPEIDISDALLKVDSLKESLDEGLDLFGKKLDVLKKMSEQIGDELDVQNIMLKDLDKKVDDTKEMLDKLNKKVEDAQKAVGNTTIFVIIIILLVVMIVLVVVAFILFRQFIQPILPTFKQ